MVLKVTQPANVRPIVNNHGMATQEFNSWVQIITNRTLIIDSGSPEGVISAGVGAEYMDTSGTASAIKYIKRDADIAGDQTKGWILI